MEINMNYCTGCVYLPMCGKRKDIHLQQNKGTQLVKSMNKSGNLTFCLDRKLSGEDSENVIRIMVGDKEVDEYIRTMRCGDGNSGTTKGTESV